MYVPRVISAGLFILAMVLGARPAQADSVNFLESFDPDRYDAFGRSVAMHKGKLIVGEPYDDANGNAAGAAYVSEDYWSFGEYDQYRQVLGAEAEAGDMCGFSVAISGNYAVVGCPYANNGQGKVVVYRFNGTYYRWFQRQVITAGSDAHNNDRFGYSVAIARPANDGYNSWLVVGAPYYDGGGTDRGKAYVFSRLDGEGYFVAHDTLVQSSATNSDQFGKSVAVAAATDNAYFAIGIPYDDATGATNCGSVNIFQSIQFGSSWYTFDWGREYDPNRAAYDYLGYSVAMTTDWVIAGAPYYDTASANTVGKALMFSRSGYSWSYAQALNYFVAWQGGARSGFSVGIRDNYAIVGAPYADNMVADLGSVAIWENDSGYWSEIDNWFGYGNGGTLTGYSVAIGYHALRIDAVAGQPYWDDGTEYNVGRVMIIADYLW